MKDHHPEALLLARVGDFYEAYGEDAETLARALQLALTGKDGGGGKRVAMAGVPHHALERYLAKLVAQRFVVAIADQMEAPVANKLVRREVVRIVTPGTLVDEQMLERSSNNYLAAVVGAPTSALSDAAGMFAFVYADLSTGEANATIIDGATTFDELLAEMHRIMPAEILLEGIGTQSTQLEAFLESLGTRIARERLPAQAAASTDPDLFSGFSRDESIAMGRALDLLQAYAKRVGFAQSEALRGIRCYRRAGFLALDQSTRRHLELTRAVGSNAQATLLATLDTTRTAMGARLLSRWILAPLVDRKAITARADSVATLLALPRERVSLAEQLGALFDLERIAQKVRFRRALPRDLASLRRTLAALAPLREQLGACLPHLADRITDFAPLASELERSLLPEPAANLVDGGVMCPDVDPDLAECLALRAHGRERLNALEETERERTGLKSLKIKYASAFGYSFEVSTANAASVPDRWIRRQTLTNAERFVTQELKDLEAALASAATRAIALEEQLYRALVERVALDVDALLEAAEAIAEVDVFVCFAQNAAERGYVRPVIVDESSIEIIDGRHPVMEALRGMNFVPNDVRLETEHDRFLLLTGPNMGGKSTYLRQTAMLVILAQIGSFVPAKQMHWGIVDRIFTRIGAGDDLASGQSTFYLEMAETAQILARCTRRSLVLIDEVGRGTGTSDGLAIAQAICEYLLGLAEHAPMVLFATHFHELVKLAEDWSLVANYHVTALEQHGRDGAPVFSHRILRGSTSRSFGIDVAKMAGLPESVITRARELAQTPSAAARPRGQRRESRYQLALDWRGSQ